MKYLLTVLLLVSSLWAIDSQDWTRIVLGNDYSSAGGYSIFVANVGTDNFVQIQGLAVKASMNDANGEVWVINSYAQVFCNTGQGWVYKGEIPGCPGYGVRDICARGMIPAVITFNGLYVFRPNSNSWENVAAASNFKAITSASDEPGVYVLTYNNTINKYQWDGELLYTLNGPMSYNTIDISLSSNNSVHVTGLNSSSTYFVSYMYLYGNYWAQHTWPMYLIDHTVLDDAHVFTMAQDQNNLGLYKTYYYVLGQSITPQTGTMNNMINDVAIGSIGWSFGSSARDGMSAMRNDSIPISTKLEVD